MQPAAAAPRFPSSKSAGGKWLSELKKRLKSLEETLSSPQQKTAFQSITEHMNTGWLGPYPSKRKPPKWRPPSKSKLPGTVSKKALPESRQAYLEMQREKKRERKRLSPWLRGGRIFFQMVVKAMVLRTAMVRRKAMVLREVSLNRRATERANSASNS